MHRFSGRFIYIYLYIMIYTHIYICSTCFFCWIYYMLYYVIFVVVVFFCEILFDYLFSECGFWVCWLILWLPFSLILCPALERLFRLPTQCAMPEDQTGPGPFVIAISFAFENRPWIHRLRLWRFLTHRHSHRVALQPRATPCTSSSRIQTQSLISLTVVSRTAGCIWPWRSKESFTRHWTKLHPEMWSCVGSRAARAFGGGSPGPIAIMCFRREERLGAVLTLCAVAGGFGCLLREMLPWWLNEKEW